VNSSVKTALAAVALSALTLWPKLLLSSHTASADGLDGTLQQAAVQHFLADARVPVLGTVEIKKTGWRGWRVDAGDCLATAFVLRSGAEGVTQLRVEASPAERLFFVYDGRVLPQYPFVAVYLVIVRNWFLQFTARPRWYYPLVAAIVAPPQCKGFRRWPWKRLWDS